MEEKKNAEKNIREEYNKLKDKYSLPDYDSISKDFEIENIDADENILRSVIKEMYDHIEFYLKILEGLIQPDSKLCDMKEAGNFNETEQAGIIELYRKCMLLNRALLLANLDYTPETAAKEIIETYKEWQSIKKDMKLTLIKMRNTWKQETKKEEQGGYFG